MNYCSSSGGISGQSSSGHWSGTSSGASTRASDCDRDVSPPTVQADSTGSSAHDRSGSSVAVLKKSPSESSLEKDSALSDTTQTTDRWVQSRDNTDQIMIDLWNAYALPSFVFMLFTIALIRWVSIQVFNMGWGTSMLLVSMKGEYFNRLPSDRPINVVHYHFILSIYGKRHVEPLQGCSRRYV